MNRYALGLLVVVALVGTVATQEKADTDLAKIEGAWKLTSLEIQGKTIPARDGAGTFIFGKDNKLVMKEKGKADKEGTFTMDAGKNPKELDLIGAKGKDKENMQTIYQLDGDTLKLAFSAEGPKGGRPTVFDSKKAAIMILKRQKQSIRLRIRRGGETWQSVSRITAKKNTLGVVWNSTSNGSVPRWKPGTTGRSSLSILTAAILRWRRTPLRLASHC